MPLVPGGGGGAGDFDVGTKSSSKLFCSPSLKYSSNATPGLITFFALLLPFGGPLPLDGGGRGGADVIDAGMITFADSPGACVFVLYPKASLYGDTGLPPSPLILTPSNSASPGPATGPSVSGAASLCSAPNPNTHPNAPSPPQLRLGVMVTSLVIPYS